ncbi:MAG: hypothetical protein ACD_20C00101G0002 [uncultured bacterium]|nr:MAG: hypothetical protein ACD_20C00101G0002 [uncultured bacterium]
MQDKNYNTKIISNEISKLFADLDKFIDKKNECIDDIKKVYLNLSTNN